MNKTLLLAVPFLALLQACGGSSDEAAGSSGTPLLGAALAANPIDSSALVVDQSFDFPTARTIDIEFDIDSAAEQAASVSICTVFDAAGDAFDVNYDSCTVQGELVAGQFFHSMEVTNDITSVAGVVWFDDAARDPMMQVFSVSLQARSKGQSSPQKIIWR